MPSAILGWILRSSCRNVELAQVLERHSFGEPPQPDTVFFYLSDVTIGNVALTLWEIALHVLPIRKA